MGMIKMIKSCVMANALLAKPIAPTSKHLPLMSRSQNDCTGAHAKIVKNCMMTVETAMKPRTAQQTMRKRRSWNICR